jgi:ribonuclease R
VGSKQLNQVLKDLEGHPEQKALHQLALRSMMQAIYSSETSGHYGLGARDYLHFTSPIRRYPDLLVHRLLKHWWKSKHELADRELEELESMAQHSSERERAAMLVEREVNALYACLLMKSRVGESFAATVSSLAEHGFFVELDDLYVEGLVKGETVYPDFEFDQATYRITYGNGRVVKVGQHCTVTLVAVNLTKKQMDFVVEGFADEDEALTPYDARPAKKPRGRNERGGGRPEKRRDAPGQRQDARPAWKGGKQSPPWQGRSQDGGRREQTEAARPGRGAKVGASHGRGQGETSESRRPQPPGKPWQGRGAQEPQPQGPPSRRERDDSVDTKERRSPSSGGGFDPRDVLDRLWRERGGKKGAPAGGSRGRDTPKRRR